MWHRHHLLCPTHLTNAVRCIEYELGGAANRQVRKCPLVRSFDHSSPSSPMPSKTKGWLVRLLSLSFYFSYFCSISRRYKKRAFRTSHQRSVMLLAPLSPSIHLRARLQRPRYQSSVMQLKVRPCPYPRLPILTSSNLDSQRPSLSASQFAPAGSPDPAVERRIWQSAASDCDLLSLALSS